MAKATRSRSAQVDLIAPKKPSYPYFLGLQTPAVRETHIMTITFIATGGWVRFDRHLEDASAKDYDVVIVPGGVWNSYGSKPGMGLIFASSRLTPNSRPIEIQFGGRTSTGLVLPCANDHAMASRSVEAASRHNRHRTTPCRIRASGTAKVGTMTSG
jgi:hypothetical protein